MGNYGQNLQNFEQIFFASAKFCFVAAEHSYLLVRNEPRKHINICQVGPFTHLQMAKVPLTYVQRHHGWCNGRLSHSDIFYPDTKLVIKLKLMISTHRRNISDPEKIELREICCKIKWTINVTMIPTKNYYATACIASFDLLHFFAVMLKPEYFRLAFLKTWNVALNVSQMLGLEN